MRISPCNYNTYNSYNYPYTARKQEQPQILINKNHYDRNYSKELMQFAYVVGVSILGITGIFLGTKGKIK